MRKSNVCLRKTRTCTRRPSTKVAVAIRSVGAIAARISSRTEACLQAEWVQCQSEVLHVAEKHHPVSWMAITSSGWLSPQQQFIVDQCLRGVPGHATQARCSGCWLQLLPSGRELSEWFSEPPRNIGREKPSSSVFSHALSHSPVACSTVCALDAQDARPGRDLAVATKSPDLMKLRGRGRQNNVGASTLAQSWGALSNPHAGHSDWLKRWCISSHVPHNWDREIQFGRQQKSNCSKEWNNPGHHRKNRTTRIMAPRPKAAANTWTGNGALMNHNYLWYIILL